VWGMPGLVHASGLADAQYPLDQLALEITRRVLQSRASRYIVGVNGSTPLERTAK